MVVGRGPGLFGKLPAKGDFITRDLPPVVLQAWEGWLQAVMATSRDRLGPAWAGVWRAAPIWRFWIGPDVFGTACAGAMMASVDKVGRLFPLVLILPETGNDFPPPPVVAPFERWYATLEARLQAAFALDSLPDVGALLDGLAPDAMPPSPVVAPESEARAPEAFEAWSEDPPPEDTPSPEAAAPDDGLPEAAAADSEETKAAETADPDEIAAPEAGAYAEQGSVTVEEAVPASAEPELTEPEPPPLWPPLPRRTDDPGRAVWAMAGGSDAVALLADVAGADHYRAAAGRSYWWTTGGNGGMAAMIALQGLPDSAAFILLLQGGRA